jgi:hypothetical protein
MATTTPNFGWSVPTSTDLVKDGATAIETLGDAIDASLLDLKGGTTGQVLSKNSNTDMDFTWVTDAGDISGVTAGTGITGGGTSGTVTITNDMATTITAAGDIVVGTGSGTYDNLPIGTTGQVLTADTTVSPYKVKWASPSAAAFAGCSLTNSANTSLTNATNTAMPFDTETFDVGGFHDTATNNSRITIPAAKAGYYQFNAYGYFNGNATGSREMYLHKNGASFVSSAVAIFDPDTGAQTANFSAVVSASVADYFTLIMYQDSGASLSSSARISMSYLGA